MAMNYLLASFVTLFILVNPIGNLPLFDSLLHGIGYRERLRTATLSTMFALITLIVFSSLGVTILGYFPTGIYSFKIAGGILLIIVAMQMLFGIMHKLAPSEESEAAKRKNSAFIPLAVPLQVGPGAIAAGIILASGAGNLAMQGIFFLGILLTFLISYFVLIRADSFLRLLGEIGTKVITRIFGLILAAIAVQFIVDGIAGISALI